MSRIAFAKVRCPHCGKAKRRKIWSSINVTLDQDLKQKFLDGEINTLTCTKCGMNTFINAPLLYHDMQNQFCAWYIPAEMMESPEFRDMFGPESKEVPTAFEHLANPAVFSDMAELIQYVASRG